MDDLTYNNIRIKLLSEFYNCMKHRWWLSARARVRKLAQLELNKNGVDIQVTYALYGYCEIGKNKIKRNGNKQAI